MVVLYIAIVGGEGVGNAEGNRMDVDVIGG